MPLFNIWGYNHKLPSSVSVLCNKTITENDKTVGRRKTRSESYYALCVPASSIEMKLVWMKLILRIFHGFPQRNSSFALSQNESGRSECARGRFKTHRPGGAGAAYTLTSLIMHCG